IGPSDRRRDARFPRVAGQSVRPRRRRVATRKRGPDTAASLLQAAPNEKRCEQSYAAAGYMVLRRVTAAVVQQISAAMFTATPPATTRSSAPRARHSSSETPASNESTRMLRPSTAHASHGLDVIGSVN